MGESRQPFPANHVLYRSIVEGAGDLVVAFDATGTVAFANGAAHSMLGLDPAEVMGRNVLEFIHPDDMERAVRGLALNEQFGSAPGSSAYRLLHADGSWNYVNMTGGQATDDGERVLYTSISRRSEVRFVMSETLLRLAAGASLAETLRPVCDTFDWQVNGSQIGISWCDDDGVLNAVSTGIDLELVGAAPHAAARCGDVHGTPWSTVRHAGAAIIDLDLSRLDTRLRAKAEEAGYGAYWIEPIPNPTGGFALVTVWTRRGGRPPQHHALAMETVPAIVEVILRWVDQQRRLDYAVNHDSLTGLANRQAFFAALRETEIGGSVLYCDLDGFKAINDTFGHPAGDELLRVVAERLQHAVRADDLIARLGGDEFVVLCKGASEAVALAVAARIEQAVAEPFALRSGVVTSAISVGIASDPLRVGIDTMEEADRQLYKVKAARRPPGSQPRKTKGRTR